MDTRTHATVKHETQLRRNVAMRERRANGLGYRKVFRYQKYREEFALHDVVVAVDETPVGTYVEIEGSDGGITSAARALGRGPGDYIIDSYRTLFVRSCEEQGRPIGDMVFAER